MKPLVLLKLLLLLSVFQLRGNPTKNPKSTLNGQKGLANTASLALPSVADIDAAIATSETQGRIVKVVSGGLSLPTAMKEVASLPVTFRSAIDGWNYDITVLAMNFTATGSMLTVACKFTLQEGETGTSIYFAGIDVPASGKNGFKGELNIVGTTLTNAKNDELSPEAFALLNGKTEFHEFPLPHFNSNLWMGLDEDSKVSFSCGAFEKFTLSGFLKSYNTVEQETLSGGTTNSGLPYVVTFSGIEVADWQDMYFNGTPANGFHATSYPDLGFHFIESPIVAVDLSKRQNPPNLPSCANLSGAYWQGIYFERFDVRLPGIFNLKSGGALPMAKGSNLFIDNNGLIGQMVAEKVFALPEGTAAGIANSDMSLLKITANYTCGGKVNALMNGQIQLPNCDPSVSRLLIDYRLTYDERAGYSYVFSNSENRNSLASNTIRLANGSSMTFMVNDGNLSVNSSYHNVPQISTTAYSNTICLNTTANISLTGCTDNIEWNTSESISEIEVQPTETTVYKARCYDQYCIEATSNDLEIKVLPSLTTPILEATSYEFCADNDQTISNTATCEGIIEWQYPGSTDWVKGSETVVVSFPTIDTRTTLTYGSRCSLNDNCWSEIASIDLEIIPAPAPPAIVSAGPYEQCSKDASYLSSSCEGESNAQWYVDGQKSWEAINYKAQIGNHTYNTTCTNSYGCESKSSETISHNVEVCAPVISITDGQWDPCNGQVVKLEAKGCEGIDVQWFVDGVAWGTGPVRFANKTDFSSILYEAKCLDAGNLSWVSNSIRINYKDCSPPIGNATITIESGSPCNGQNVVLKASGCGDRVHWYKNGSPLQFSNNLIVSAGDDVYHASCYKNGEETYKSNDIALKFEDCSNGGGGDDGGTGDDVCASISWSTPSVSNCIISVGVTGGTGVQIKQSNESNWHNGNTYDFTASGNGNYEFKYQTAEGCSGSGSVTVSTCGGECDGVNINPPSILPISAEIDEGQSVILSATGCSGNVIWSNGQNGNTINVSPIVTTSYTSICQIDACNSISSNEVTIIVREIENDCDPPAKPILARSKNNVCAGEGVTLSGSCSQGTFMWGGAIDISKIFHSSVDVSPNATTTYSATCNLNGCKTSSSITVNVVTVSQISISATAEAIKVGESSTLNPIGCEGASISWGLNGNSASLTVNNPAEYTLECFWSNCNITKTAKITIKRKLRNPTITVNSQCIKQGSAINVSGDCPDSEVDLVWLNPSGFTGGNTNPNSRTTYSARCDFLGGRGDLYENSDESSKTVDVYSSEPTLPSFNVVADWVKVNSMISLNPTCSSGSFEWTGSERPGIMPDVSSINFYGECVVGCARKSGQATFYSNRVEVLKYDKRLGGWENHYRIGYLDKENLEAGHIINPKSIFDLDNWWQSIKFEIRDAKGNVGTYKIDLNTGRIK